MIFNKRHKSKTKTRVVKKNELMIRMRDGNTLCWYYDDWQGKSKIEPWKHFYKWFFGRSSQEFIVKYDIGETMIRREDIIRFTVHIYTTTIEDD